MINISFTLNGKKHSVSVAPETKPLIASNGEKLSWV